MNTHHSGTETELDVRESILEKLKRGMDDLEQTIYATTPETSEEQQLQLRRYHELGYLANQYRNLKRDTDLNEMDQRLALLEDESDEEAY